MRVQLENALGAKETGAERTTFGEFRTATKTTTLNIPQACRENYACESFTIEADEVAHRFDSCRKHEGRQGSTLRKHLVIKRTERITGKTTCCKN